MNVVKKSNLTKGVNFEKSKIEKNQPIDRKAEIKAKLNDLDISNLYVTGETLLNRKITNQDFLLEGMFPRTGVAGIGGSSDTGKSSFLRQLAIHIATGESEFIGFKLTPKHNNVIYVSTEDDENAMSFLLQRQTGGRIQSNSLKNLKFIFDTNKILLKLEYILNTEPTDCIIIDTFTDIYDGDMNAANKMRSFINNFVNIAKKYNCLIIFLHHTTKNSDKSAPSKNNFNGSQGFEAKMRLLIELRKDRYDSSKRHMCIVKGNYLPESQKENSFVLIFNSQQIFTMTDKKVNFESLGKNEGLSNQKIDRDQRIIKLMEEKLSIREISDTMKSEGFQVEKSTIQKVIKNSKLFNSKKNLDNDQIDKVTSE